MSDMFIVPITPITPSNGISGINAAERTGAGQAGAQLPFSSFLEQAINNVKETSAVESADAYDLALGDTNELHNLQINQEKAYLALELLQSVRNKVLDSYKEIMNMGI